MAFFPPSPALRSLCAFSSLFCLLQLLLLLPGGFCENCETYQDSGGHLYLGTTCPDFCCGNCISRYCCSDVSQKFDEYDQLMCNLQLTERTSPPVMGVAMKFKSELDDWHPMISHGPSITPIIIVVAVIILIITTIVVCFTCSCCCLYKACRRSPQPIVTTTTATTVVQVPYPQQPNMPAGYPAGVYQGYSPVPVQPQPGMPAAPYPTQYPPPYHAQPTGPPPYHETMAAGAGAPATQPPYNPAYMDPTKPY